MEQEENVYATMPKTEDVVLTKASVETGQGGSQGASAILGKFKDVNALARAYEALEAEFTKRSQRLRELEKKAENFERKGDSGVEKLRKNAEARKAEEKRFDDFVAEVDKGKTLFGQETKPVEEENTLEKEAEEKVGTKQTSLSAEEVAKVNLTEKTFGNEGEKTKDTALTKDGSSVAVKDGKTLSSEEVYTNAMQDETVRLRIIGEYLASIGKSGAPLTMGGGSFAAPPLKARNIAEAGTMALRYFKKGMDGE